MSVEEVARLFALFAEERRLQVRNMTAAEETVIVRIAEAMERLPVISAAVPARIRGTKRRQISWPALSVDVKIRWLFLRASITMSTSVRNAAISIR